MNEYVWKLDVEYPIGSQDDSGYLVDEWEPAGWEPDADYLLRMNGAQHFIWPKVERIYRSRSSAVNRAKLLERYGARVRLLRSVPLAFEERQFRRPLRVIQGGAA